MKTLDTDTVLEIIKLIDYRLNQSEKRFKSPLDMDFATREYFNGKVDAYDELSYYLQQLVEGQLNAAELSTGE